MNDTKLEELSALVEEIRSGKRVVLLAPGLFTLIAVIGLLIIASVAFFGSLINTLTTDVSIPFKAILQFASMGVLFVFVVWPSLMIFQGKKKYFRLKEVYSLMLLISSMILNLLFSWNLIGQNDFLVSLLICSLSSLAAWLLMRSSSYCVLKEFYYLLKQGRRAS